MQELLNLIFWLSEQQGAEVCYNPQDGKFYKVIEKTPTATTLLPLEHGAAAVTVDFNPNYLIFRNNLKTAKLTAFNGVETEINGTTTDLQRHNQRNGNGIVTDLQRNTNGSTTENNGTETELRQTTIGKGKTDLQPFAILYTGETAAAATEVEKLLDAVIKNTNKEQTLQKIIQKYENAKQLAAAGQVYELRLLAKNLQGLLAKQNAMQQGVDTMKAKRRAKIKMFVCVVVALFITVVYAVNVYNTRTAKKAAAAADATAPTLSPTLPNAAAVLDFETIFNEYEQQHGVKIYNAGRKCLKAAAEKQGCTTKQQVFNIIKKNM